jgi:hypothetical protein
MAFIPPVSGPNPLEYEVAEARQREIEAKASRHAQLHPDEDGSRRSGNVVRRAARRVRSLLGRDA